MARIDTRIMFTPRELDDVIQFCAEKLGFPEPAVRKIVDNLKQAGIIEAVEDGYYLRMLLAGGNIGARVTSQVLTGDWDQDLVYEIIHRKAWLEAKRERNK